MRAAEDKRGCRLPTRGRTRCARLGEATPPKPSFLGTRVFDDYSVAELIDYIDWSPFFSTWELTGKYSGDPR